MEQQTGSVVRTFIEGEVPGRGQVRLSLNLGLVTDTRLNYQGTVMVLANAR